MLREWLYGRPQKISQLTVGQRAGARKANETRSIWHELALSYMAAYLWREPAYPRESIYVLTAEMVNQDEFMRGRRPIGWRTVEKLAQRKAGVLAQFIRERQEHALREASRNEDPTLTEDVEQFLRDFARQQ